MAMPSLGCDLLDAPAVILPLSLLSPLQALGPYSTSKTALLGLTKALASELAPAIRVNCIAPGIIKTKFSSAVSREGEPLVLLTNEFLH